MQKYLGSRLSKFKKSISRIFRSGNFFDMKKEVHMYNNKNKKYKMPRKNISRKFDIFSKFLKVSSFSLSSTTQF